MIDETEIYFIDANIPMYAVGAEHRFKTPCVDILRALAEGELKGVTDSEVLQEILHRYTALGQRERAVEVYRLFSTIVTDILSVTKDTMDRAVELHLQYTQLQARDSLHTAVMLEHKIKYTITADRHFDGVSEIVRIDPGSMGMLNLNINQDQENENPH